MNKKLFVIAGPTAVGKSETAVKLASAVGTEVISADSMQIYKGMDIGTGKLSREEMRGIRHHMIDVAVPDEEYSVGRYVKEAAAAAENIAAVPVVAGGTGLYITALITGSDFGFAGKNDAIREKWKNVAAEKGKQYVYDYLKKIDVRSAEKIDVNDIKRIIRAIEIYEITGVPKSRIVGESNARFSARAVILTDDREKLYSRIDARVEKMFVDGLADEVEGLMKYRNCISMQAIGYKETARYISGEITLDEAKQLVKKNSKNYAKRQMTYFNGMKITDKTFVKYDDFDAIFRLFSTF